MSIFPINAESIEGLIVSGVVGTVVGGILLALLMSTVGSARRLVPGRTRGPIPFVSFIPNHYFRGDQRVAEARLSNAGNTPAYNVEVFTAERWPDGQFQIRNVGDQGLSTPILGMQDSIELAGIDMFFEGCSVMVDSRYWIEYDNIAGEHFRAEARPMSARGDAESASPPVRIKRRLERLPGSVHTGDFDEWEQIRIGIASFEVAPHAFRRWLLRRGRRRDGPIMQTRRGEVVMLPEIEMEEASGNAPSKT